MVQYVMHDTGPWAKTAYVTASSSNVIDLDDVSSGGMVVVVVYVSMCVLMVCGTSKQYGVRIVVAMQYGSTVRTNHTAIECVKGIN